MIKKNGRKRGFYRAVNRQEEWALKLWKYSKTNPVLFALAYSLRNIDIKDFIYKSNPLLDLIDKKDSFSGAWIPIKYD